MFKNYREQEMFTCRALSSWTLALAVRASLHTRGVRSVDFLLIFPGFSMLMGGLFAIPHDLPGPAAIVGLRSFCVAAVLITVSLRNFLKSEDGFLCGRLICPGLAVC
jgi:hypothetical protein